MNIPKHSGRNSDFNGEIVTISLQNMYSFPVLPFQVSCHPPWLVRRPFFALARLVVSFRFLQFLPSADAAGTAVGLQTVRGAAAAPVAAALPPLQSPAPKRISGKRGGRLGVSLLPRASTVSLGGVRRCL